MLKQLVVVVHLSRFKLMIFKRFVLLLSMTFISVNVYALSMDDFMPDFLSYSPSAESQNLNPHLAFSIPESSQERFTNSNESYWYCDKLRDPLCTKQNASSVVNKTQLGSAEIEAHANLGANEKYFNRNSNLYDQNAVANFNITNSNQAAMQAYAPQLNNYSTEDTLKHNIAIPLKPSSNTAVSVGTNNVQFNMSY